MSDIRTIAKGMVTQAYRSAGGADKVTQVRLGRVYAMAQKGKLDDATLGDMVTLLLSDDPEQLKADKFVIDQNKKLRDSNE